MWPPRPPPYCCPYPCPYCTLSLLLLPLLTLDVAPAPPSSSHRCPCPLRRAPPPPHAELTLQVKDLLAEPPLDAFTHNLRQEVDKDADPEAGRGPAAGADTGEGMDVDGDTGAAAERKTAREAARRAREGAELFCEVGKWLTEMAAREVGRPVHEDRRALERLTPKPLFLLCFPYPPADGQLLQTGNFSHPAARRARCGCASAMRARRRKRMRRRT
jgi:hypothetical protein